ncbi:MAG: PIN domain-containing protein [Candidatus Thermoplasmatota archaeon]
MITERGHLYEFARELLKRVPAREVRGALAAMAPNRLDPTDDDLIEAAKLKRVHPRMSAQDALGYMLARREGLLFLTGDTAFRKMTGVEFVK